MLSISFGPGYGLTDDRVPIGTITKIDASTARDIQIKLARSAAPSEVSAHADIYVLGKGGYELAVKGSDGFSCIVEREHPDTLEPECYDGEGTRTTLQTRLFWERERAKGKKDDEIERAVQNGYSSGAFRAPGKPGIVYMLSDHNYVFDPERKQIIHFPGHLMFYAPNATPETVGSGKGAPYIVHPGRPDALMKIGRASCRERV